MTHLLDPSQIRDETQYCAALDELEDLMLADPGRPSCISIPSTFSLTAA